MLFLSGGYARQAESRQSRRPYDNLYEDYFTQPCSASTRQNRTQACKIAKQTTKSTFTSLCVSELIVDMLQYEDAKVSLAISNF